MGIMIFMLKSQRRAFRWPNNFRARLYICPLCIRQLTAEDPQSTLFLYVSLNLKLCLQITVVIDRDSRWAVTGT